jgi:hypothetical protein
MDLLTRPIYETEGRILRSADSLYLCLTCRQKDGIWAVTPKESTTGSIHWKESGVEIFFGRAREVDEKAPYAQYLANAFGAFQGYGAAKDNREGVRFETRIDKEKGEYTLEAVLPLKARGYDFAAERVLSFNVFRKAKTREGATVEDMPQSMSGWYPIFATPHQYGSRGIVFME